MRRTLVGLVAVIALGGVVNAAGPDIAPTFVKKPAVARTGDGKVKIEFAINQETDVAVYVEDDKDQVVRHLVAGVLGKNPPEPLKPDSLEQSIVWDGTDDDGKPAAGGPFKVRVGLGLKASWGGTAFSDQAGPNHISSIEGLATGSDGRVYVMDERRGWLYCPDRAGGHDRVQDTAALPWPQAAAWRSQGEFPDNRSPPVPGRLGGRQVRLRRGQLEPPTVASQASLRGGGGLRGEVSKSRTRRSV